MPGLLAPTPRQADIMSVAGALTPRFSPRADEGRFPHETYPELHATGYGRLTIPAALGGGADVFEMALAQEVLARGDAFTALVPGMRLSVLVRAYESRSWPDAVLADVSREVVAEGGMVNNCVTEPELGLISRGPGCSSRRRTTWRWADRASGAGAGLKALSLWERVG